jgi:hypothetical protein
MNESKEEATKNLKERLADMSALSQSRTPADALKYIEELEASNEFLRSIAARGLASELRLAQAIGELKGEK